MITTDFSQALFEAVTAQNLIREQTKASCASVSKRNTECCCNWGNCTSGSQKRWQNQAAKRRIIRSPDFDYTNLQASCNRALRFLHRLWITTITRESFINETIVLASSSSSSSSESTSAATAAAIAFFGCDDEEESFFESRLFAAEMDESESAQGNSAEHREMPE